MIGSQFRRPATDPQRWENKGVRNQMNTEKTLKELPLSLSQAWENEAERWATWARKPGHDSYWQFHRDQFFTLVSEPGMLTVDVGCGGCRRDFKRRGHKVIGIDVSATLIRLAREEDPKGKYFHAPASCMPLEDVCADLAIAFMSLQDVDDLEPSVLEIARVLQKGGRACLAIVHPINSAGKFASGEADSEFIIKDSYLDEYRYSDWFERAGPRDDLLQPAPAVRALQPGSRTSRDGHRSDTRASRSRPCRRETSSAPLAALTTVPAHPRFETRQMSTNAAQPQVGPRRILRQTGECRYPWFEYLDSAKRPVSVLVFRIA
jgi:SAM-dependent methyltransferase